MLSQDSNEEQTPSSFNMAVATLMRLDAILKDIKDTSKKEMNIAQAQHTKARLVKDFYVQASALIRDDEMKKPLWIRTKSIELKWEGGDGRRLGKPTFSNKLDIELDELLIDIQSELQKTGVFMPERFEEGL